MKIQSFKSPPIKLDTVLGNQQSEDGIFEPEVGKSKLTNSQSKAGT